MFPVSFSCDELTQATGGAWRGPRADVSAVFSDTREFAPDSVFFAFAGERFDGHDCLEQALERGAKVLCIQADRADRIPPGASALVVPDTVRAFQNLARFHRMRFPDLKVAALTGSCGKTSAKEALRAIFSQSFGTEHVLATEGNTNNQIGVPQNLLRLTPAHRAAVLEMGTNHPGEIEPLSRCASPDGALIVSIGSCHLEFLGSLRGVAEEKAEIFRHLSPDGCAVIPASCPERDVLLDATSSIPTRMSFGLDCGDVRATWLRGDITGSSFRLTYGAESAEIHWGIPSRHQAVNAAGAAAIALAMGVSFPDVATGLANTTLPGLRMRTRKIEGATWINDAYNANPDSMEASLRWLRDVADPKRLTLVLGDMGELGESSEQAHRRVVDLAMELFPASNILFVGERMTEAAAGRGTCFPNAVEAKKGVVASSGWTVFVKGSRFMRMEEIEPA